MSQMGERRLAMLGASLRRYDDPARSTDPQLRALVARLGTIELGPRPDPGFRAELRAQLVAVAPRLVAEGVAEPPRAARKGRRGTGALLAVAGTFARLRLARPVALVAGALTLVAVLVGGAVWVSQRALPGDALYGLKRASESVALSLTSGEAAKARRYLSLAGTRAGEVSALLSRTAAAGPGTQTGGLSPDTTALVDSTLSSADDDLRSASQLLGAQSIRDGSPAPLDVLTRWAPGQLARLGGISAALPSGQARNRALASLQLLRQAVARATSLQRQSGCRCLGKAPTDPLGPVPCVGCTPPVPGAGGNSGTPGGPSNARTSAPGPGSPGRTGATVPSGAGQRGVSGSTATGQPLPTGAAPTPPTGTLPTSILSPLPSVPTSILPTVPPLPSLGGLPGVGSAPLG